MKLRGLLLVIFLLILCVVAYRMMDHLDGDDNLLEVPVIPVQAIIIQSRPYKDTYVYQGVVVPVITEVVAFKSSGRLALFNGDVGGAFEKGSVLAALDTEELQRSLEGAKAQLAAAEAGYKLAVKGTRREDLAMAAIRVEKAQEAVDYLSEQLADLGAMFLEGIVSQAEFDGLQLELTLAEQDLALVKTSFQKALNGADAETIDAAAAQVSLAKNNIDVRLSLLEDAVHIIEEPRILMQKMYEIGELVPAGYPVALLRSPELEVILGVTGEELPDIDIGQTVRITTDNSAVNGIIDRIAEVPDEGHFLYEVAVGLGNEDLLVGDIATCEVILGDREVIAIPITAIMNDGIDYVYLAVDNEAVIRKVDITGIDGGLALVTGLEPGDVMIATNLNRIHERSLVQIEE